MSEDFQKYIEQTPIEIIIKHELFYQLNHVFIESDFKTYWKIMFEQKDSQRLPDGQFDFFGSKSPYKLFTVYKLKS